MLWDDFYDRYPDWAESTLKSRVSALEDIGPGEEVVDVCLDINDEKIRAQLLRKALKMGVNFTRDDFLLLDGEVDEELLGDIARHADIYVENPYFDEHDFDWDEFFAECGDLPEDMVLRCIPRIQHFGPSDEVAETIMLLSSPADDALYGRAIACGIKFTEEQLDMMGRDNIFFTEEIRDFNRMSDPEWSVLDEQLKTAEEWLETELHRAASASQPTQSAGGALLDAFKGLFGGKKKHSGRCDGNCARCPAHYGYRYGRWYYGHGHQYGCEFGGNRGGGNN